MTLQESLLLANLIVFSIVAISNFLLARLYRKVLTSNKKLREINRQMNAIQHVHHEEHKRACRYAPEPFAISAN